ncbi:protein STPG4 [Candoia aspera]|uniref:protein STPG4 n=1 Tax=Candoia aspera TaxID=51853 RepID=UPI002FD821D2
MIGGRLFRRKGEQTITSSQEKLGVSENEKISDQRRDTWWKEALRPTPIPGFYPIRNFLEDAQLNPVKPTYNFKSEGRKRASIYEQLPDLTLPHNFMYNPPSFVELAEKRPATYSFKSTSRQSNYSVYRDKHINTDPGRYDLFPSPVPTFPSKSYMFRSAVQRLPIFSPRLLCGAPHGMREGTNGHGSVLSSPTIFMKYRHLKLLPQSGIDMHYSKKILKKEGPGPGEYELRDAQPIPIRSSFISEVPRLLPAHTKVPGPGYYWPTKQSPRQPRTIASLGREHTIFFSNVPEL